MRTAIIVSVLFLLPMSALFLRAISEREDLRYYSPENYVKRANALINKEYLRAECEGDEVTLVTDWPQGSEVEEAWFEESYLKGDVERFNREPDRFGWTFFIDDTCRLEGVDPSVHAVPLPFATNSRWLGRILYSGQRGDATLSSIDRTLTMVAPREPISAEEQKLTQVGKPDDVSGSTVLLHFSGGSSQQAARFYYVGDDLVMQNRTEEAAAQGRAWLLGYKIPEGRMATLEDGDWIRLAADRPLPADETFVFLTGEAQKVASRVRRQNDRSFRTSVDDRLGWYPDRQDDEPMPLVETLSLGIDNALATLTPEAADQLGEFDVRLSIRRDLHKKLDDVFYRFARRKARETGRRDLSGGVTVMDGLTGEVLAAATYPRPEDVLPAATDDDRSRYRRLLNQNFVRHPIGSAGKPFLFAAVANVYPSMLGLEIDGHEPERRHRDLLHCALDNGYQLLPGHGGAIGFTKALEISCNKYAVEIMMLALAARDRSPEAGLRELIPDDADVTWPKAGDSSGIHIGGEALTYAPDLGRYFQNSRKVSDDELGAVMNCGTMDRLEQLAIRSSLTRLTGAATYRGRDPLGLSGESEAIYRRYITNRYDLRPWSPLIDHLASTSARDAPSWQIRAGLQGVSPERVNLSFNDITHLRQEFVSLTLGGATSSWTNVQLAEALSRLVSGRKTQASLVSEVLPEDRTSARVSPQESPQRYPLRAEVRAAVLEGLQRVVMGRSGTAKELANELAEIRASFPDTQIFAKTGSPILERPVPRETGQALIFLLRDRLLSYQDGSPVVTHGGRSVQLARDKESFRKLLTEALSQTEFRGNRWRIAGALLRVCSRLLEDIEDLSWDTEAEVPAETEISGPLYVVGDSLRANRDSSIFGQNLLVDKGSVFVFSLVRSPSGVALPTPEELEQPGAQVVTVAVHLTVGPDSSVAVAAAREILAQIDLLGLSG